MDSLNAPPDKMLNPNEMKMSTAAKYPKSTVKLILKSGQNFIFRVGLGKKKEKNEDLQYYFQCEILEDLYAYKKGDSDPRLCDCNCIVNQCVSQNLKYFEPIYGTSLNQVATNTISHFFSLKRSSSLGVATQFKLLSEWDDIDDIIKNQYQFSRLPALANFMKSAF